MTDNINRLLTVVDISKQKIYMNWYWLSKIFGPTYLDKHTYIGISNLYWTWTICMRMKQLNGSHYKSGSRWPKNMQLDTLSRIGPNPFNTLTIILCLHKRTFLRQTVVSITRCVGCLKQTRHDRHTWAKFGWRSESNFDRFYN